MQKEREREPEPRSARRSLDDEARTERVRGVGQGNFDGFDALNEALALEAVTLDLVCLIARHAAVRLRVAFPEDQLPVLCPLPKGVVDALDALGDVRLRQVVQVVGKGLDKTDPLDPAWAFDDFVAPLVEAWCAQNPSVAEPVVFDPACGTGGTAILAAAELARNGRSPRIIARDTNPDAVTLTRLSAILNEFPIDVEVADSLLAPGQIQGDVVIIDPPIDHAWGAISTDVASLQALGHYSSGLPPVADATWLFVQLVAEALKIGGIGALLVPTKDLTSSRDALRKRLVSAGVISMVASLPSGTHGTGARSRLSLVTLCDAETTQDQVAFVNLASLIEQSESANGPARIPDGALRALRFALGGDAGSEHVRRVHRADLMHHVVEVGRTVDARWTVTLDAPGRKPVEEALSERYGAATSLMNPVRIGEFCDLSIFDEQASWSRRFRDYRSRGWTLTRMSALLLSPPHGVEQVEDGRWWLEDGNLYIVGDRFLTTHQDDEGQFAHRSFKVDEGLISPDLLAMWLNDDRWINELMGNTPRSRAINARRNLGKDLPSLEFVFVPLPAVFDQDRLSGRLRNLARAKQFISTMEWEAWDFPEGPERGQRRIDSLLDESLTAWATGLPFPMASAIRSLDFAGHQTELHRQLFAAWESYVVFLATLLLSAARRTPERSNRVQAKLEKSFSREHMDPSRAGLGMWQEIIRICSAEFRSALQADAASREAVVRDFGGVNTRPLSRILSIESVKLIELFIKRRNTWQGHGGSLAPREIEEQIVHLVAMLNDLQALVGEAWDGVKLMRAGGMEGLPDGRLLQEFEVCMGFSTPFRKTQVELLSPTVLGRLYVVGSDAVNALPLLELVQLRSAPDDLRYTAYFYNRLEAGSSRLVTYQYGSSHEDFVARDLAELIVPGWG